MAQAEALRRHQEPAGHGAAGPAVHGLTLHVVGRLTPPLASFVMPTIQAMCAVGMPQALVFIDDAYGRDQVATLPAAVRCMPVPDGDTAWARRASLSHGMQALTQREAIGAMHLYGLLPGLVALRLLRHGPLREVPVYFSPHSSRAQVRPTLVRAVAGRLVRLGLGRNARHDIVNLRLDEPQMADFNGLQVQVVECPVPQVFFDTPRQEAKRPLLIACNLEGQRSAVDGFLRIAVLLNDERLGISFNWVGPALPDAAAAIRAGGIGQYDAATDASRAQRMGAAWVYVAASDERGFPVRLAEAMAAGLPCVALDSEVHRSMITDDQTGYLCADLKQLLLRVGQLVDSPALRQRLGQAARREALERFSEAEFRRQLWRAIGSDAAVLPGADTLVDPRSDARVASPPWR